MTTTESNDEDETYSAQHGATVTLHIEDGRLYRNIFSSLSLQRLHCQTWRRDESDHDPSVSCGGRKEHVLCEAENKSLQLQYKKYLRSSESPIILPVTEYLESKVLWVRSTRGWIIFWLIIESKTITSLCWKYSNKIFDLWVYNVIHWTNENT